MLKESDLQVDMQGIAQRFVQEVIGFVQDGNSMLQKCLLCSILMRKDTGLRGYKALIDKRDQLFSVIYSVA